MGVSKEVVWVGSSKQDLKEFPEDVQDAVGYALYVIQLGDTPDCAKPFKIRFQKKSKHGIKTPKHDVGLVRARLQQAQADYRFWKGG